MMNNQQVDYSGVDWDLPDAEIARRLGITREGVRQARKRLEIGAPALKWMRLSTLRREENLICKWKPDMKVKDAAKILNVSYGNAYRILRKHQLPFVKGYR